MNNYDLKYSISDVVYIKTTNNYGMMKMIYF